MLRNMSQENTSPPGVACNVVETVDHKAYMAVAKAFLQATQLCNMFVVVEQAKVFSTQLLLENGISLWVFL